MAIEDIPNQNLFGTTNYNFLEDTNLTAAEKRAMIKARFLGEDISPKQPKAVTMADTSNPAFEGMSAPEIIEAVNTPGYESPSFSIPGITDEPRSKGMQAVDSLIGLQTKAMDVPLNILKTAALPIVTAGKYLFGTENSLNPTLAEAKASASESIPKGSISDLINPETRIDEMASRQDQLVKEFLANESNVNPSEILPPAVTGRDPNRPTITGPFSGPVDPFAPPPAPFPVTSVDASRTSTPLADQTISQFMRYEDNPANRTEQFLDPQGRLRLRLTEESARLRGEPIGSQPLAPQYQSYEADAADREERLGANLRQFGENQSAADTRAAQSRTTGGQTEGISFDDARIQARGQLASKGIKDPSVSQINDLARSIQAGPASQFQPKVVEVGGQKLIQLAPEYFQPVRELKPNEKFEPRVIENNGVVYFEESLNNFKPMPSPRSQGQSGSVSTAVSEAIAAGNQGATPATTSTSPAPVGINSPAEYDALPAGTPYIDSQGTLGIKK
jgi:hypothetical protein